MSHPFIPKILLSFRQGYTLKNFQADLLSGLIVGILSIPMAIAFAIASGARPEKGIITACIAGAIGALTTGSRYQITGPTGAFVVLISAIIAACGYTCLLLSTLLAGVILLTMGFTRLGFVIKFIPYPVTIGFTSGIALLIFTTQVPDFLGLKLSHTPHEPFWMKWHTIISHAGETDLSTLLIGGFSLGVMILWKKLDLSFPGSLAAIIFSVLLSQFFSLPVETLKDRFGEIALSFSLFSFSLPSSEEIPQIISSAIAIALLAGIESLLSAVVADGMSGRRHNSNMELVSQGFANIGSALFGGLPATGAIARTATNIKSGGFSPVAALICSAMIALLLLYFDHWVGQIPFASLAAILFVVAYNMSECHHFVKLFRSPASDITVLLATFFLTIFVDLVTAIEVGIILAAFMFIHRMGESAQFLNMAQTIALEEKQEEEEREDFIWLKELHIPNEVQVFEIRSPLFFAAAEKFKTALSEIIHPPKILILRVRHLAGEEGDEEGKKRGKSHKAAEMIDATGMRALEDILEQAKRSHTEVIFSGITKNKPLFKRLVKAGILEEEKGTEEAKGEEKKVFFKHFPNIQAAIHYAKNRLEVLNSETRS